MSAVLVTFSSPTRARRDLYWSRALGEIAEDGRWEGYIEFVRASDNVALKTGRETAKANRSERLRWA